MTSRPGGWIKREGGYRGSFLMCGGRRVALDLDFLEVQYEEKTVLLDKSLLGLSMEKNQEVMRKERGAVSIFGLFMATMGKIGWFRGFCILVFHMLQSMGKKSDM